MKWTDRQTDRQTDKTLPDKNEIPVIGNDGQPKYVYYKQTHYSEGQRFYCKALTGKSIYNFSINADLTVSCHCELREVGQLGDLKTQSLAECFDSERANYFRRSLADGCLISSKCLVCCELQPAPNAVVQYYLKHHSLPKSFMLENTSVCNLKCKDCYNAVIKKTTISLRDMKMIARQLAEVDVENIWLFKTGEPFVDSQLNEKIDVLKKYLPKVVLTTSTNGMLIDTPAALEGALKLDLVIISLDGFDEDSAAKYQVGTSFEKVCANIKRLVSLRNERKSVTPVIRWKNVLFSYNYGPGVLERVFQKARELGVDELEFLDGGTYRKEDRAQAIQFDSAFSEYMERYEWKYVPYGATYIFKMKNDA